MLATSCVCVCVRVHVCELTDVFVGLSHGVTSVQITQDRLSRRGVLGRLNCVEIERSGVKTFLRECHTTRCVMFLRTRKTTLCRKTRAQLVHQFEPLFSDPTQPYR